MAIPQTSTIGVQVQAPLGFPGMISDSADNDIRSYVSGEASAEVPYGQMVKQGATDRAFLRLTAGVTQAILGVLVHSQGRAKPTELGATGLKPKMTGGVMRHGRCWVTIDENVTPASAVRVRVTDVGGVAGTFRTSASAGNTVAISSWARFTGTFTAAGGVAEVEFDALNSFVSTAD